MSEKDLCYKCLELFNADYPMVKRIHSWLHCHHEPKEKEKCWCEHHPNREVFYNGNWHKASYCPECGTPLTQDAGPLNEQAK